MTGLEQQKKFRPVRLGVIFVILAGLCAACTGGLGEPGAADRNRPGSEPDTESDSGGEEDADSGPFGFGGQSGGPVGFYPESVAAVDDVVWVSDWACGIVLQLEADGEGLQSVIDTGRPVSDLTYADGSIWAVQGLTDTVVRLDPVTAATEATITVPGAALATVSRSAGDEGSVWVGDTDNGSMYRIDTNTSTVVETVEVGGFIHHSIVADGVLWAADPDRGAVWRIDGDDGAEAVETGPGALHVAVGANSIWVTNSYENTVTRLNAETNAVEAIIEIDFGLHAIDFANGMVWVGSNFGVGLWRVDPGNNSVEMVSGDDISSIDMDVKGDNLWIAGGSSGSVFNFDTDSGEMVSDIKIDSLGDCEQLRSQASVPTPSEV